MWVGFFEQITHFCQGQPLQAEGCQHPPAGGGGAAALQARAQPCKSPSKFFQCKSPGGHWYFFRPVLFLKGSKTVSIQI